MGRQIHRYIKAMHGSLAMLEKFEARMKTLTVPQREEAMARYIDLNRKVVKDLSWRMLVRAPSPTIATRSITLSA